MATRKSKTTPAEDIKAEEIKEEIKTEEIQPAPVEQSAERTYTASETEAMIAAAVAKALAEVRQQSAPAPIPEKERVNLLWQAPVMAENVEDFGVHGQYHVTGPTSGFWVPKEEFPLMITARVRFYLEQRWLIVLSGLTDEEREIYGVNYRPGEYLTKQAFAKLAEQGPKLLEIYPQLCKGNRQIVAGAVYQGWKEGNKAINRGLVEDLAALCRKIDPEETTFQTILVEMAEKAARG